MSHGAFIYWSHLSAEQEKTAIFWQSKTIYSYWQADANAVSLPPGVRA